MDTIFRAAPVADAERSDRSAADRQRHREKVRASIRSGIADIVADEAIIGRSGEHVVRVPLRGIKEYRFVFGDNSPGVTSGDGSSERGQVIGRARQSGAGPGSAGDEAGDDVYETEITLEELVDILFEDLELPDLERKALRQVPALRLFKHKGYRSVGVRVRLDKRRTARERIKRQLAARGHSEGGEARERRFPFHTDDLRFRHLRQEHRPESNAVVLCIMDTSGSMDTTKKYLARSFFFLLHRFIASRYEAVEVAFIAHHTEAKEVSEDDFFHRGESGGTMISSGYLKALEVIHDRYHPALWNIYCFHCSDGDNFTSDNGPAIRALTELTEVANLVGYCEIEPGNGRPDESTVMGLFRKIDAPNFQCVRIDAKEELWPALQRLLSKDLARETAEAG